MAALIRAHVKETRKTVPKRYSSARIPISFAARAWVPFLQQLTLLGMKL